PATVGGSDVADGAHSPRDLAVRPVHRPRRPGILPLATGVLRKLLRWACWRRRRSLGSAVPEMAHGSPPFAVVRANVRARGAPGVVERLLEALCETRMETTPATPMGLASRGLHVRDDRGGLCHSFQHGRACPTEASEPKYRISRVMVEDVVPQIQKPYITRYP